MRPLTMLATVHGMRGDFATAEANLLAAEKLSGDPALTRNALATIYLATRNYAGVRRVLARDPSARLALLEDPAAGLAELRRTFAQEARSPNGASLFGIVLSAAFWGDPALSLEAMRAMDSSVNILVIWQPGLQQVRQLPGFKDLLRELGLVDYWRSTGRCGEPGQPVSETDFVCR